MFLNLKNFHYNHNNLIYSRNWRIKTLLLIYFTLTLYATEIDQKPIVMDKKQINISKNRILDYQITIESYRHLSKKKQLKKVNLYLNQLLPQYDKVIQDKEDYWATPKEFLTYGFGDCEDYAIIKYFTLLKLGFDEKKLFLTTVRDSFNGGYHMVLSYFEKEDRAPMILDNLSFKILDLQKRKDLKANLFINSTGVYKITDDFKLKETKIKSLNFEELLKRNEEF